MRWHRCPPRLLLLQQSGEREFNLSAYERRSPCSADRGEGEWELGVVVRVSILLIHPTPKVPEIVCIPEVTLFGSFDTESSARGPQTSLVQVI